MKTKQLLAVLSVSAFSLQPSALFAQGSLTPPGAPGATMKSLDQIEARTPISSAPFTITVPGSYYLTTNLTVSAGDAITISAGNVTLDLNGFTITGTAAVATTGFAIALGGVTNVAIYNGHISSSVTNSAAGVFGGGGFAYGIYSPGSWPYNVRVKAVSVAGVLNEGINLGAGYSSVVEACAVNVAGGYGINADSVADSTAMNCGSDGIVAGTAQNCTGSGVGYGGGLYASTANNCFGSSSGSGYGLYASAVATGCSGSSSTGTGLNAFIANNCYGASYGDGNGLVSRTANNCYGTSNGSGNGLYATYVATDCYGSASSGVGLSAGNANNCHGTSSGNGNGLSASNANNCYGTSYGSGTGLSAGTVATGCYGQSSSGTGLNAFIASLCYGSTSSGVALITSHNVNSF